MSLTVSRAGPTMDPATLCEDLTAQRLLQNQADMGNAIKPFYGDAAGTKLTELLNEHILGAADLLTAAKAGHAQFPDKFKS